MLGEGHALMTLMGACCSLNVIKVMIRGRDVDRAGDRRNVCGPSLLYVEAGCAASTGVVARGIGHRGLHVVRPFRHAVALTRRRGPGGMLPCAS